MSWNDHWRIDEAYIPLFERLRECPECVLKRSPSPNPFLDPNFGKPESLEVVQIPVVPNDGNIHLIFGHSITPRGIRVPSVFVTSNGGSGVLETYWYVNGRWYQHYEALWQDYEQLVPFVEDFSVPVET
ncbi:MAG: hypothetical protein KDA62_21370 [Planctomycetales bacterium]|nr:hypothetical protein [Planctomycetales bacterium]